MVQSGQLGIGIRHILHLGGEPCIACSPRIGHCHRCALAVAHYHPACVEHVEHGKQAVSITLREVLARGIDSTADAPHLLLDVLLDEFLVAAELGGMVAAHALVMI